MIKIFGQTDTNFNSNGDLIIEPLTAVVHNEMDGEFYLELSVDLKYVDWMERGNIVVAPTPQGEQAFRIDNPIKTGESIETKAWHVFYDTKNYVLTARSLSQVEAGVALRHIKNNAIPDASRYSVYTDNTSIHSCIFENSSLFDALTAYQNAWGGHLLRDNYSISYMESLGVDRGITIEYAKNLTDITCEEDWDEVCTTIVPIGKDGCMLNLVDPNRAVYIDADVQYDIPYCKTVTFEQDYIEREDYGSDLAYKTALVADLQTQATAHLNAHKVPKVNYEIEAYANNMADIGDTIEVKDKRLGISLMTEVIAYDYNCITGVFDSFQFGNFTERLSNLMPTIDKKVDKEIGKGLSSNDFTDADLTKLTGIEAGATKTDVTNIASNNKGSITIGDVLIQWGLESTVTGSLSVTFPFTYSATPNVQATSGNSVTEAVSVTGATKTGFVLRTASASSNRTIRWLAVGKA